MAAMTPDAIRAAVAASPELLALAKQATADTQAIADALSLGRTRAVPTEIGNGTILEVLGLTTGNALLDVINNQPDFRHVKPLVEQGRLRLDSVLVQATLQSLVPAVLTQAQATALLARAQMPDPVPEFDVRCALWADDGALKV